MRWSLLEASAHLRAGTIDPVTLTQHFLTHLSSPSPLNDYLSLTSTLALTQARASLIRLPSHPLSLLDGIPVAIKDNISLASHPTTAASLTLSSYSPPYTATAVTRLTQAGAIILGKTNLDEFGMGSDTTHSHAGPTLNPWSTPASGGEGKGGGRLLSPGGSSGGSAAAVAAYRAYAALGSDTGGSVRLPAAYCGVVGFKPTYGQVSRWGLLAYASSLDTVGVIARTVKDCRAVYRVIAGPDEKDSTCLPASPPRPPSSPPSLSSLTVGVPVEANVSELSDEMRHAWMATVAALQEAGCNVVSVSLPHTSVALSAYYILAPAEASSNLARYDGVRYGHSASPPSSPSTPSSSPSIGLPKQSLQALYTANRGAGFGPEVQRRILLGTFVLSSAAYSSYFVHAQQVRQLIADDYARVWSAGVDCVLTPTAVGCAPTLEEVGEGGLRGWVNDVMTVGVSLAGLPAVSVPVVMGERSGLPLGMQVVGRWMEDERLLDVAERVEQLMQSKTGYKLP